jgi:hypothetical protein
MPTTPSTDPACCVRHRPPVHGRVESRRTRYVLAVDLGTGGPKVAVISATGRIAAHAFEAVGSS